MRPPILPPFPPPHSADEAAKNRYAKWSREPEGRAYIPGRCAFPVAIMGMKEPFFDQCAYRALHGPDKLYCSRHAALLEARPAICRVCGRPMTEEETR